MLAKRVEQLRGLRFKRVPRFDPISPQQAAAQARTTLNRDAAGLDAQTTWLRLTRVVPPTFDVRTYFEDIGTGVTDKGSQLQLVADPALSNASVAQQQAVQYLAIVLDEQNFRPREDLTQAEPQAAYSALLQGDAQVLAQAYDQRYHLSPPTAAPANLRALPFPLEFNIYGTRAIAADFVNALRQRGHGYGLVNRALSTDPPRYLDELVTPVRYLQHVPQMAISMTGIRYPFAPRGNYKKVLDEPFDSIDAIDLLATTARDPAPFKDTAGWNGGRVQLWRKGEGGCPGTCSHDAFAIVWTSWLTDDSATAFATEMYRRLQSEHGRLIDAKQAIFPDGEFKMPDGGYVSIDASFHEVSIAWTPDVDSAANLTFEMNGEQETPEAYAPNPSLPALSPASGA